jgi:diguanylate cyclase (GGDEF)-like protein/PAS domain S-box-containing protein
MEKSEVDYKLEFEDLINIIPSAIYVIKGSVIIDCNNAALNMFGYEAKEEVIGLRPYELSPDKQPDGRYSIVLGQEIINDALLSQNYIKFQWVHKRKNKEIFLTDIMILNKNGILYAIILDINEINQLREQLIEKDYIYRMLFENHNGIMMLIDSDAGNIVEVNQAAIKYYGYTKDQLLNMKIQDINTLSESQIDKEIRRANAERRNYFQFIHRLANNEKREVEVYSFPIEVEKRKLLFSIIHDVSEKLNQKLMFDTLFFDSPYGVVILDKEQKIVNVNKNFSDLFQYSLEEVKGKAINNLVDTTGSRTQIDGNIQLIYRGEIIKQEGVRRRKDGRLIEVEILAYPVINHQEIIGVYIIYIDISHKKTHEKQLLLFKNILENNSEGVVITDTAGRVEWINNAFSNITGYLLVEVLGKKISILKSGINTQEFYKGMWEQLISNGRWHGEIWNKNKEGDIYSEWLSINSIKDDLDNTTHFVGIFKDLTEKRKIDIRINELQQKDLLTGLCNRNYFLDQVNSYIEKCREEEKGFSIILINLKGFEEINSSLGHSLGDKLLIEISKRLMQLTGSNDILSRFGGDEFIILHKSSNSEKEVIDFSSLILNIIKQPFRIENTMLHVTANIGISMFPQDATESGELIRCANIAMYSAKKELSNNRVHYLPEMSKQIDEKFFLANELVDAINKNELSIRYQPIFDIKQPRTIVGAEALLRWENPILGAVSPAKFIPVVEKTGQIIPIGEWVLEQVCKQISIWQLAEYHIVPISVNISVKQLEQAEFAKIVVEIIKRNNIKTNSIELEITESVSSGDLETIINNLKELKNNGIKISMDDFGTGFSSLGQLELFELDKLKIDKIFLDDIVSLSRKQKLVKSIIAMAKGMDLTVVAEGIETKDQLLYLRKLGCQFGQGYLVSKPLSVEELETLFIYDKHNSLKDT